MRKRAFGITLTSRLKHAALHAASKRAGGQSAFARSIGVTPAEMCSWVNLRSCPPADLDGAPWQTIAKWGNGRLAKLEADLLRATGQTLSELFPPELRGATDFLNASKTIEQTRDIDLLRLSSDGCERLVLPSPADVVEDSDYHETLNGRVASVLRTLHGRERDIIKLRFGIGCGGEAYTLREVSRILKIGPERVRQIEAKAIRKMQEPYRANQLSIGEPRSAEEEKPLCPEDWKWFVANEGK